VGRSRARPRRRRARREARSGEAEAEGEAMNRVALGLVAALLCVAGSASAETPPSAWDRAKRPAVEDEYELHVAVQRLMSSDLPSRLPPAEMLNNAQHLRILAMLQAADAEKSSNPLLRFDLGYAYDLLHNYPRAAQVFKSALEDFPNHPLSREARFTLAIACGHIGDHECESKLYREIIAEEAEPARRVTSMLNLAETEMHAHDLREAIEGYREVYRLCGTFQSAWETPALALWGLAVALDRAGEIQEAQTEAHRALSHAQNHAELLTAENIFFYPEYEVRWYQALTAVAQAKHSSSAKEALMSWQKAERYMQAWIDGATRHKDYWLPIAEARLKTYKAERERAEKQVLKEPPEVHEPEGWTLTL
jgi:tetratricopeptide (TPR) repeat protein